MAKQPLLLQSQRFKPKKVRPKRKITLKLMELQKSVNAVSQSTLLMLNMKLMVGTMLMLIAQVTPIM